MGTGNIMKWIDEVKQRRSNLEAERKAQAERADARQAQIEADWEAKEKRRRNKEMDKFRRRIEPRLPAGVEIVDAFWSTEKSLDWRTKRGNSGLEYTETGHSPVGPVIRVALRSGVRFDLVLTHVISTHVDGAFTNYPSESQSDWHEVDIYNAGRGDSRLLRWTSSRLERRPLEEALYDALTMEERRLKNSTQ